MAHPCYISPSSHRLGPDASFVGVTRAGKTVTALDWCPASLVRSRWFTSWSAKAAQPATQKPQAIITIIRTMS